MRYTRTNYPLRSQFTGEHGVMQSLLIHVDTCHVTRYDLPHDQILR